MIEEHLVDPSLSVFNQLFAAATRSASLAMCKWTNGQITLSLDEVRDLPLEEVVGELDLGFDLLTMVVLTLEGDLSGQLILTFDEENGRHLAASLLNRELNADEEWSPLEQSALNETGNILACAYIRVLTDLLGQELIPSPPTFIQDFGASVLEQAIMSQAVTCERAIICRTCFERAGEELDWNVFFVPSQQLLERLEHAVCTTSESV